MGVLLVAVAQSELAAAVEDEEVEPAVVERVPRLGVAVVSGIDRMKDWRGQFAS